MDNSHLLTLISTFARHARQGTAESFAELLRQRGWERAPDSEEDATGEQHWHLTMEAANPTLHPHLWFETSSSGTLDINLIGGFAQTTEAEEVAASICALYDQESSFNRLEEDPVWTSWTDRALRINLALHPVSTDGMSVLPCVQLGIGPVAAGDSDDAVQSASRPAK